jgi:hypothetical protein
VQTKCGAMVEGPEILDILRVSFSGIQPTLPEGVACARPNQPVVGCCEELLPARVCCSLGLAGDGEFPGQHRCRFRVGARVGGCHTKHGTCGAGRRQSAGGDGDGRCRVSIAGDNSERGRVGSHVNPLTVSLRWNEVRRESEETLGVPTEVIRRREEPRRRGGIPETDGGSLNPEKR